MEKEFIPYEEALALKELGFDEECLSYYNWKEEINYLKCYNKVPILMSGKKCGIPLYQQAFRWFREKYKLESSIQRMPPEVYGRGKGDIKHYLLYIWAENLNPRGQQALYFDTYEEAELSCLRKLIEIIKK